MSLSQTHNSSTPPVEEERLLDHSSLQEKGRRNQNSIINTIGSSIRGRIDKTLGWLSPIPRTYRKITEIGSRIKQRLLHFFKGDDSKKETQPGSHSSSSFEQQEQAAPLSSEVFSSKPEAIAAAYRAAEEAELEHMTDMGDRFFRLQNNYRKQLKHSHPELNLKYPVLAKDPKLMQEAALIADRQARQGIVAHTTQEYRLERKIDGENLNSGTDVDFAHYSLKKFLASDKHRPSVSGDFSRVGYAIRKGKDDKTGKEIYFLVVLYGGGTPQDAEQVEIPDKQHTAEECHAKTLEEATAKNASLQASFKALQMELKDADIELRYEAERTAAMQNAPAFKGLFSIALEKAGKKVSYLVFDRPPLLLRRSGTETLQIPFSQVMEDFESHSDQNIQQTREDDENQPTESSQNTSKISSSSFHPPQ